jgi:uncharacterized protein (TIGR00369 family)
MSAVSSILSPANPNFERAVRDAFAKQELMARLGGSLVAVGPGYAEIELPHSPAVSWEQGRFATAAVAALGESAGICAALAMMPAGSEATTVDYKINFIRPAQGSLLRASGRVIRPGQSVTVVRVAVRALGPDANGECALLLATVLRVNA